MRGELPGKFGIWVERGGGPPSGFLWQHDTPCSRYPFPMTVLVGLESYLVDARMLFVTHHTSSNRGESSNITTVATTAELAKH